MLFQFFSVSVRQRYVKESVCFQSWREKKTHLDSLKKIYRNIFLAGSYSYHPPNQQRILIINFQMSSDAENLVTKHRLSLLQIGAKRAKNV